MLSEAHNLFIKSLGLITEPNSGESLVEISGDQRVLVENHKGVVSYSGENVRIRTTYGLLSIAGLKLEVVFMTEQQLVITGVICGISIERG